MSMMTGILSPVIQTGDPQLDGRGFFFEGGDGQTGRRRAYHSAELDAWVLVLSSSRNSRFTASIRVDDSVLPRLPVLYNGKPAWGGRNGATRSVFYSAAEEQWIYNPDGLFEPAAVLQLDGTWDGDAWWYLGTDDPGPDWTPAVTGGGENLNDGAPDPPSFCWFWPRWQWDEGESKNSEEPYGVYTPEDFDAAEQESNIRYALGVRVWKFTSTEEGGVELVLRASADGTDEAFYLTSNQHDPATLTKGDGDRWSSDWNVPHENPEAGWWGMESAPTTKNGARLDFKQLVTDNFGTREVTLTFNLDFDGCISSGRIGAVRMGEVAQWR